MRCKTAGQHGDVAQLEEHLLCKQGVVGSSPIISTAVISQEIGDSPNLRSWVRAGSCSGGALGCSGGLVVGGGVGAHGSAPQDVRGSCFTSRRDSAVILLLVDTGMRRAECAGTTLDDVDLDQRGCWARAAARGHCRSAARPPRRSTATYGPGHGGGAPGPAMPACLPPTGAITEGIPANCCRPSAMEEVGQLRPSVPPGADPRAPGSWPLGSGGVHPVSS